MFYVINKMRQPLALNVNDGTSLHLFHLDVCELSDEQLNSVEIHNHLRKRNIAIFKSYKFNDLTVGTEFEKGKDRIALCYEYTGTKSRLKKNTLRTLRCRSFTRLDYDGIDVWISSQTNPENSSEIMARILNRAYNIDISR